MPGYSSAGVEILHILSTSVSTLNEIVTYISISIPSQDKFKVYAKHMYTIFMILCKLEKPLEGRRRLIRLGCELGGLGLYEFIFNQYTLRNLYS